MRNKLSVILALIICGTTGRAAAAQSGDRPVRVVFASISAIAYRVTFTKESAARRIVTSEMSFDVAGDAPVILSLPSWTPGEYELGNFARNVSSFSASQGGQPIERQKVDPDSWRIRPKGAGRVTVTFDYAADTLDNGASWARRDFLLFNGTNLFLYPEGSDAAFAATVTVATDSSWKIVTGMERTGNRTYSVSNYHDLVDMPFFVGAFDLDSAEISGKWVRLATYPAGSVSGSRRAEVWSSLKKVIPPEVSVFGEVPWRDYSVMQITDSMYAQGSGAGLEHQSSHVDIVSPSLIGTSIMPSLYAHEIFHAWNVKRLRPADMVPYRYDKMQPTKLLWISEGITDYYADLAEVRGGEVTPQEFYELTHVKIGDVAALPPTSLEDASLSAWIKPRDGTEYVYYPKGSLAGMLIDILIRDATDNRASLDDVMRGLYNDIYKKGRGFTDEEWWSAVGRIAGGKSFADFRRRYVEGREALPYASIFALAGLKYGEQSLADPRVGVATIQDSSGVKVIDVAPGSSAGEAGVLAGDYLIAVGDIPVTDSNFGAVFRPKYAKAPEGTPITIRVRRAGVVRDLPGKLRFGVNVSTSLDEDPSASAKARAIRAGLLSGTTRP